MFPFLFIAFVLTILSFAIVSGLFSTLSWRFLVSGAHFRMGLLNKIAKVFRGQVIQPRESSAYTLVRIRGQLYYISIERGAGNMPREFLSIRAAWSESHGRAKSDEPFRMSLTLERVMGPHWYPEGRIADLELGNAEFDRRFYIKSNNDKNAKAILTSQAQHLIQAIYREGQMLRFELRVSGEQVQLDKGIRSDVSAGKVFRMIRRFAELHTILVDSNVLMGQVKLEQVLLGSTVCLICGDVVSEPKVTCSGCRTEYHLDCWKYVGLCGRYACGGTSYLQSHQQDSEASESPDVYRID